MIKVLAAAALLAGGAALVAERSLAVDGTCTNRTAAIEQLGSQYGEAPVAMGLANNGGVIELLRSKDGATWTLLITMPDGRACPIAAGEGWESLPLKARGERI